MGTCTVSKSSTDPHTCVNRDDLGQYLVTYTASDASGNKAEPVAFSFLFIDPFVPKLGFSSYNAHVDHSYSSRMFGYPNIQVSGYPSFDGSVEGKAIFPGTNSFGCGASCEEDRLDDTTGKTWGALYSAVGSESANKALVDTLWTTAFTVAPDAAAPEDDGDSDLRTLTGAGGSYTPTTISASAINALNLASTYGTHTVKTKTSQDYEAGVLSSRRYGGFFDEVEKKEQDPDKGVGFCANKITNPSAVSCADKDQTNCGTTTGCKWHGEASAERTSALWAYDVRADASDNYRCTNLGSTSCTALKVYYQLTEDSTKFEWALASAGEEYVAQGQATTGKHNIVMKPGKKVRISWFVDDSAGDFSFKQMSNPQTHTIQFSVTDKTRPILTPAQKAAYTATDFQTDAAGFALNPTTMNNNDLTNFGYASVTCAQINDENLCTGTCSWDAASGCTGSGAMQSCVSKVVSTASDDSNVCYDKATAAACWTVKNQCFWTTSKTFTDGTFTDGTANAAITCTAPMVEYTYYVPDCTATTKDPAGKQNAKCNAESVRWTSSNEVKYNAYRKCRPADNVVDRTSFTTLSKNAYTTVVECGYKEDNNPWAVSNTIGTAKSGYQEFGARAFDNWDNVREYSDNGNTATEYKDIDLFTDGAATAGTCATTDGTTSPNWVSCAKQSGTPAAPQTSFVGNTLSHKTAVMGQGGYGAIYNGQLKKATTGVQSRWPQRGLYYRSGLLNCDDCDEKDFEDDFLVVYRYTDKEGNSARPLMRKVVTRDTTPPTVRLVGDRTLENSAGSYVHSTASSNSAQCVQAQNRSAACDTAQTVDDKSSCETAGCIW